MQESPISSIKSSVTSDTVINFEDVIVRNTKYNINGRFYSENKNIYIKHIKINSEKLYLNSALHIKYGDNIEYNLLFDMKLLAIYKN